MTYLNTVVETLGYVPYNPLNVLILKMESRAIERLKPIRFPSFNKPTGYLTLIDYDLKINFFLQFLSVSILKQFIRLNNALARAGSLGAYQATPDMPKRRF